LCRRGVEPVHVALTWTGSAFHRAVPRLHRTQCGRVAAMLVPFGEVGTMDYCRMCFGPGAFVRCGECGDMGVIELPELLPCPTCRPVEHTAEREACGLPVNPSAGDHPNGPV
jgi:hypothetical protein